MVCGLFEVPFPSVDELGRIRELLIYLAFPAAQGCVAEIDDGKSLISKPGENRILAAARTEKARMAYSAFP
jgi:hypothetical protein